MSIFSARGKEQILPFQLSSSETHLHGWGQMLIAKFEFLRLISQVLTETFMKLTRDPASDGAYEFCRKTTESAPPKDANVRYN